MSNFFASKLLHLQLLQLASKALRLNKKIFKVNRKASSKKLHAYKNGLQNQLKEGIWWGRKSKLGITIIIIIRKRDRLFVYIYI